MRPIIIFLIAAAIIAGGMVLYNAFTKENGRIVFENGLELQDVKLGAGAEAALDKTITVHYVGTLDDGTVFDSSRQRGAPATFTLSEGKLIRGWTQGIPGMKVGGVRRLTIPSELGYGAQEIRNPATGAVVIPANSTLHFEVELFEVK